MSERLCCETVQQTHPHALKLYLGRLLFFYTCCVWGFSEAADPSSSLRERLSFSVAWPELGAGGKGNRVSPSTCPVWVSKGKRLTMSLSFPERGGKRGTDTHTHTHTPGNSGWRFTLQMESVCSYYKWRLHVNVSPPAIFRNSSPVALYTWNKINTDCHKSGPHAFDRKCIIHIVQIRDGSRWSFC